jgi:multidrug transporter EmrE-like cation transporter
MGSWLIFFAAAVTMAANLSLRVAIERTGSFKSADLVATIVDFVRLLFDRVFALGFIGYFAAALLWFKVLASEPLSIAYPAFVATTYVLVTGGAVLFLHETLSMRKVVGLAIILAGIAVVSTEGRAG